MNNPGLQRALNIDMDEVMSKVSVNNIGKDVRTRGKGEIDKFLFPCQAQRKRHEFRLRCEWRKEWEKEKREEEEKRRKKEEEERAQRERDERELASGDDENDV